MKLNVIAFSCMLLFAVACNEKKQTTQTVTESTTKELQAEVVQLSENQYKELIFNYEITPSKWIFKGKRPCIVDCYADWCRPCKMIAPFFDTLAKEYEGKVDFYKINVDDSREFSAYFQIQSIPFVMFCGKNVIQYSNGAYPIDFYRQMIDSLLLR
ncbi:MAG: thioredoxin domain-containing protein [Bacteroidales bacterium]|nr:thioredoxin domain-containing protein [Bacteroidales bacterium]